MKKILTLLLILSTGMFVFAQQNYHDVVYLKNGKVFRGFTKENITVVSIKNETIQKDLYVCMNGKIKRMTVERALNLNRQSDTCSLGKLKYYGTLNIGYARGVDKKSKNQNLINFDFVNGIQFYPYLAIGLGTGVRISCSSMSELELPIFVPLFAEVRGQLLKGKLSPYGAIDLGYTWEAAPNSGGVGLLLNPTVGLSIKTDQNQSSRFSVGVGYMLQTVYKMPSINALNVAFGISW